MKLMTLQQYMKMTKPALIRKIIKTLRAMPKVKLARMCYNITKSKLPRLRVSRLQELQGELLSPRAVGKGTELNRRALLKEIKRLRDKGRTHKTKRKARFRKGSPEAKRYMAKLRRMRK